MNYTKGEWKVAKASYKDQPPAIHIYREECQLPIVGHGSGMVVCTLNTELSEVEANAHLMAAAPENYEANSETLRLYRYLRDHEEALWNQLIDVCPGIVEHWDRIKKALAKAERGGG